MHGTLTGLQTLHENGGVHMDVRAANVCWSLRTDHSAVTLIDLTLCGQANCRPSVQHVDWQWLEAGKGDSSGGVTLGDGGVYDQFSDMHQVGIMLGRLCSREAEWSASCKNFCKKLLKKQLTAQQALSEPWLDGDHAP